ncbi:MAG TPA: hypothetical protein VJ301_12300, partial [Propionibacteriaceae bacterium]|nr:hypothetical protein [Propionibacteriaceae bacterium]
MVIATFEHIEIRCNYTARPNFAQPHNYFDLRQSALHDNLRQKRYQPGNIVLGQRRRLPKRAATDDYLLARQARSNG